MARHRQPVPGSFRSYGAGLVKDLRVEGLTIESDQKVSGIFEVRFSHGGDIVLKSRKPRRVVGPVFTRSIGHHDLVAVVERGIDRDMELELLKVKIAALSVEIIDLRASQKSKFGFRAAFRSVATAIGVPVEADPADNGLLGNAEQRSIARAKLSEKVETSLPKLEAQITDEDLEWAADKVRSTATARITSAVSDQIRKETSEQALERAAKAEREIDARIAEGLAKLSRTP